MKLFLRIWFSFFVIMVSIILAFIFGAIANQINNDTVYLIFAISRDVFGAIAIVGILGAVFGRMFYKPKEEEKTK